MEAEGAVFVVVFCLNDPDLSKPMYWLLLIKALCAGRERQTKPRVVLVGSNRDQTQCTKGSDGRYMKNEADKVLVQVGLGCACVSLVLHCAVLLLWM